MIGPLLGGLMAAGLQKLSDRIAEDEED